MHPSAAAGCVTQRHHSECTPHVKDHCNSLNRQPACFDFKTPTRIPVHLQGVSRSATIVIAYLMWKTQKNYDEAYAHVKAARGLWLGC